MAVLGGEIDVEGVNGNIKIKIPKETQSNEKFRIKGEGVKGRSDSGDLFAEVVVEIPKKITKNYKKIMEELKELEE
ncbi:MAG TPA: hypothetical protein EYG89_00215 [Bacteroidia bacterium]|nr:hypothetical protein [Bacteroidia bacterium]